MPRDPFFPVNGGVRQVNVLENLGVADYDGLQTQISYRGNKHMYASLSYTLSKATNTTEPDGNGIGPNESNVSALGEVERGPSVLDQRHRAVINFLYRLPYNITAGTLVQFASSRPFNATTGVDNNGDGINNDRPVINGAVIGKSIFRGTPTSDVGMFVEGSIKRSERMSILLRLEGFNLLNHGNFLGRGQTVYGDTGTPSPTFGQFVAVGTAGHCDSRICEYRSTAHVPVADPVCLLIQAGGSDRRDEHAPLRGRRRVRSAEENAVNSVAPDRAEAVVVELDLFDRGR